MKCTALRGVIMIKKATIEYCEANGKYDVVVDGMFLGKHYTIEEALISTGHRLKFMNNKKIAIQDGVIKKKR